MVVAVSVALHFFACVPPRYFLPVSTLESCFALTSNLSHASLAVSSLKYLRFSLTKPPLLVYGWGHSLVCGPGMVHLVQAESSFRPSSIVFGCLSSTGFKKPSGILIWTRGQTAPLMTV